MPRPAPSNLRVEHLDEPFGVGARRPRLSWWLPEGAAHQVAYQLRAGGWDSGRVDSDQSVLVAYDGPDLASRERVTWSVKSWTDVGESDWSTDATFEMGLLDESDWTAQWIEPPEGDEPGHTGERPAWLLRGEVTAPAKESIERARLYATAHGVYEVFVNERRVGDLELTPGSTSYAANLQAQVYDLADLLMEGPNAVTVVLSDGWYRGQNGVPRRAEAFGDRLAFLGQFEITATDGTITTRGTDASWTGATGPIVATDLMQGAVIDFTLAETAPEPVRIVDLGLSRIRWSPAPPIRAVEEFPVRAINKVGDRHVIDVGQNINGWLRWRNASRIGPAGTELTLSYGEALGPDGDLQLEHNQVPIPERGTLQVDKFVTSGPDTRPDAAPDRGPGAAPDRGPGAPAEGDTYEPRHTTKGFQFVRVEGHPGEPDPSAITGVMVHSDLRRTGWFECSNPKVNQLHKAAVMSFRGNACDIPTDCPVRERSGWAGDWELFVPTAAFLYDVAGFSTKWLRDLAADQRDDGAVPHLCPAPQRPGGPPLIDAPEGAAGWGDAIVIVPWEIYRAYGDIELLAELWPNMVRWVDFMVTSARDNRHPDRAKARPKPEAHEEFLWDTGFHFGEWLEPEKRHEVTPGFWRRDSSDVATAYLSYSSRLVARIARLLGKGDEAEQYELIADNARASYQAEFIRADGMLPIHAATQANYVRALAFDLVPAEQRQAVAGHLVDLIRAAGTHLGTGFLSTPHLLPVLADTGHLDLAYELLLRDTAPSWMTMLDRGATTIWEHWSGLDEEGKATGSLNHYGLGAVTSFLHTRTAGLRLDPDTPAYRRFRVEPQPGGGFTSASASLDSPYGRIEASWKIDGGTFTLDVAVPAGTTGDIVLPDGSKSTAGPGRVTHTCSI